jgi:hypothetical protein
VKCANCGRGMREPAGYVSGAPVGPVCLLNMVGRAEVRRSRKTAVVAVDQADLFDLQNVCYFTLVGNEHAEKLR